MAQAILKLENIVKDYKVADSTVHALKGVSLAFRKKEFVSILGPSGCGKTTLLNIIGGLDKYTSGDLVIKGVSTKNYRDRDWDAYRNHSIGFVFQSYNLIPHQTVLGNVELALTLSGVSSRERKERAKQALERVGLGAELNKKPNQLSGGQMQRVAIARALVNNPEILLADEPTGALDTETSVQIMELIKEIAGERLVIMVTHNPELAERYSSRIVRLLDGQVTDDTDPFTAETCGEEGAAAKAAPAWEEPAWEEPAAEGQGKPLSARKQRRREKTSMSFITAFLLSGRNLLTKKARTAVTAIAGSIGIISVCLVLALSSGFSAYINKTEEDMLSYYPVQVTETTMDLTAAMSSFMSGSTSNIELDKIEDKVYVNSFLSQLAQGMTTSNDLSSGNAYTDEAGNKVSYLDYVASMPEDLYYAIYYGYGVGLTNNLFTSVGVGSDVTSHLGIPQERVHLSMSMLREYYTQILMTAADEYASLVQFVDFFTDVVNAMPGTAAAGEEGFGEYILSQYDVVAGKFPEASNEIVFVVGEQNDATDLTLAQLGFIDEDDFLDLFLNSQDGTSETMSIPFESVTDADGNVTQQGILGTKFELYDNDAVFTGTGGSYSYHGYDRNWDGEMAESDGVELEIVGVLRLKDGLTYGCMEEGLGLTEQLIQEYIARNMESDIVQYLLEQDAKENVNSMNLGEYVPLLTTYTVRNLLATYLNDDTGTVTPPDWVTEEQIQILNTLKQRLEEQGIEVTDELLDQITEVALTALPANASSFVYNNVTKTNLRSVIRALGGDNTPNSVAVYARDFDSKDEMLAYLDGWNSIVEEQRLAYFDEHGTYDGYDGPTEVTYTDTVGTLMGLMNVILNAITYVLVAFTGISLVVSTVMIGVITYVSVVERTKEIGVLRSIGARKKDIRHVFNAESFIVGLCSGLLGVVVAYVLQLLINAILLPLTGIAGLAALPFTSALIMLAISIVLTLISGLIPASAAAKRDPVVALRSE